MTEQSARKRHRGRFHPTMPSLYVEAL
jgi:hypothetical protein